MSAVLNNALVACRQVLLINPLTPTVAIWVQL